MEVINAGMRTGIKAMAVAAQTMQFISLMPQPKDFVTRIVGDVVFLSAQISQLSEKMNKLLDSYADIPTNYLMTQVNSITGSLSRINNRLNTYTDNAVNQTIGLGENTVNIITDLTGSAIDITGSVTSAVVNLAAAVSETSSRILSQSDIADDIHDAAEVILEWNNDKLVEVKEDKLAALKNVTKKIQETRTGITDKIDSVSGTVDEGIKNAQNVVKTLITELREKMDKLANMVDTNFKDVTGMTSVSRGASTITEEIKNYGNSTKSDQVTSAISDSLSTVIKNFSIGKMVFAFAGVLTQSAIVRLGLDKLPPIDFESMLYKIRDDINLTPEDLEKNFNQLAESTYNEMISMEKELKDIPSEERNYSDENYKKFKEEYEEELKEQRNRIRTLMKYNENKKGQIDALAKKEIKSAIKEIEKYRKKVKNAKQAETYKSILGKELDNFKQETQYRCNQIKSDWESMMKQYRDSIAEIKEFFSNGGSCDMFIDDCCKRINQDFDDIKELCKNLSSQLIASGIKVFMPSDIGTVVPNPAYKIPDFLMDVKTIIAFIKNLITKIIDVINHINKLARIMLNGINNLNEIIKQLMEMIGLKWLMNLVQNIIEILGSNIDLASVRLVNTLSPIHLDETKEYYATMEALESLIVADGGKSKILNKTEQTALGSVTDILESLKNTKKRKVKEEIDSLIGAIQSATSGDDEKIEDLMDRLEDFADNVVAYKSPILDDTKREDKNISDIIDGESFDMDVKFIGWKFYHADIYHTNATYYSSNLMKKIKSKVIQKAAKRSHKKNGGVAMLNNKEFGRNKIVKAYKAFYWYTYYTEDLEKDCFEWNKENQGKIFMDNIVKSESGSVVEIIDVNGNPRKVFVAGSMVRSGDYVNVDGVKYRVN